MTFATLREQYNLTQALLEVVDFDNDDAINTLLEKEEEITNQMIEFVKNSGLKFPKMVKQMIDNYDNLRADHQMRLVQIIVKWDGNL